MILQDDSQFVRVRQESVECGFRKCGERFVGRREDGEGAVTFQRFLQVGRLDSRYQSVEASGVCGHVHDCARVGGFHVMICHQDRRAVLLCERLCLGSASEQSENSYCCDLFFHCVSAPLCL